MSKPTYKITHIERYEPTPDDFENETILAAKLATNGCPTHWDCPLTCESRGL